MESEPAIERLLAVGFLAQLFHRGSSPATAPQDLPARYQSFRQILALNNACLELLAALQEDLAFVSPTTGSLDATVAELFDKTGEIVQGLEQLSGTDQRRLQQSLSTQLDEVTGYLSAPRQAPPGRLFASLDEIDASAEAEAGGKAAVLAEIRNRVGLRTPDGFVITTEAYRQFCETPLWRTIRDALRDLDPGASLSKASNRLRALVESSPAPPEIEQVINRCAWALAGGAGRLAVRSSASGEAGPHGYAGQFLTLLDVPPEEAVDAWRRVVASRFSEPALGYRLSTGISEVESPLAVLIMRMAPAKFSGILYTRNPSEPRRKELWIASTRGLGADLAAGTVTGDLVTVSRKRPYRVLTSRTPSGSLSAGAQALDLTGDQVAELASAALAIEEHFHAPQDIEWAYDQEGHLWILQSRLLSLTASSHRPLFERSRPTALVEGGQTVCPGRASGTVWIAGADRSLRDVPHGSILVVEKATPELAVAVARIDGLVAEWGNPTGHAAALLREFRIPSVFLMAGARKRLAADQPVSLDASRRRVYSGALWPPRLDQMQDLARPIGTRLRRAFGHPKRNGNSGGTSEPIRHRVLKLNLLNPASGGFHPGACKSLHDVLRYCHEKAVEAMFSAHDTLSGSRPVNCRKLSSALPLNMLVLDLGGAIAESAPASGPIGPEHVECRPFQAIWKGFTHPDVHWTRDMPISFADLTSVLAGSLSTDNYLTRALGEQSYLMVAPEYFNLNARLAYHFTLIDACLSAVPSNNHVSFRFAGGGASRDRRNLRTCFIEACLTHYGFRVDRRGDLVNAWLNHLDSEDLQERLDILGRLTASTCQLDMYMTSREAMEWYVQQFIQGNYAFRMPEE